MKKFRKIMAVLVAAMMIMAMMVPVMADSTKGRLDGLDDTGDAADSMPQNGVITISNVEDGETYRIFKIFDLYSFTDEDPSTDEHANEHYSYMIKKKSPWYTFIKKYYGNDLAANNAKKYFEIDLNNPVYLDAANDYVTTTASEDNLYYFVKPTTAFENTDSTSKDEDGRDDSILPSSAIQQFAQDALKFADKVDPYSTETGASPDWTVKNARAASEETATSITPNTPITVTNTATAQEMKLSNVPFGYYLIDSTVGTLVTLDTNNPDATVEDKNRVPSINKYVKDRLKAKSERSNSTYAYTDDNLVWVKNSNYEIGSLITFKTEVTVPKGAKDYVLHDVMEKGFTLKTTGSADDTTNFEVYVRKAAGGYYTEGGYAGKITAGDNKFHIAVGTSGANLTEGSDFTITFDNTWLAGLGNNDVIEIEYKATLNRDAVVFGDTEPSAATSNKPTTIRSHATLDTEASIVEGGLDDQKGILQIDQESNGDGKNTNSTILTFGVNSAVSNATDYSTDHVVTKWAVATVDAFQFDLIKTEDVKTGTYPLLGGAKFKLYRATKDENGVPTKTNDKYTPNTDASTGLVKLVPEATAGVYHVADGITSPLATETGIVTEIETSASNKLNIEGLEAGIYFLEETKAPTGYNKIDGYFMITIEPDTSSNNIVVPNPSKATAGKLTINYFNADGTQITDYDKATLDWKGTMTDTTKYDKTDNGGVHVINKWSTELPSTGGMGTTVLYIVGGMLVILAGAYLFFSRKRTA